MRVLDFVQLGGPGHGGDLEDADRGRATLQAGEVPGPEERG